MSTDRLLTTVLGLYQDVHDAQQTERIFGSTTTLLVNLSNPLNLSLLTAHFLTAPAIWRTDNGLHTSLRVMGVFRSAALHVRRNELNKSRRYGRGLTAAGGSGSGGGGGGLGAEAWARAVIRGADDRSARWQHLLVLTGVLMGLEGGERRSLPRGVRVMLERGVVAAANLAMEMEIHPGGGDEGGLRSGRGNGNGNDHGGSGGSSLAASSVILGLNYAFPLLSEGAKSSVRCDALLPLAVRASTGHEGFEDGAVLGAIDAESQLTYNGQQLHWPPTATSFLALQALDAKPLVSVAGPLSSLIAYAVEHARDSRAVLEAHDVLCSFAQAMALRWAASRHLSGFDTSMEAAFLSPETARNTWPFLWQFLKKILYATTVVLQAVVARSLLDARLRRDDLAPSMAAKTLQILRDLHFISSRHGASAFQVYTFTYLASIDILAKYPPAAASFLRRILPADQGNIPTDALRLTADLFYLNLAEHFAVALPREECDAMIIQPALPYISPISATLPTRVSPRMVELFEAAHSAVLSVLSWPHNASITVGLAPLYADALFSSFPLRISARQFRVAFKTLMQVLSPPFPVSATHPELAETLLEMVRMRVATAATVPLPPTPDEAAQQETGRAASSASEQSALVLTMIDALPFLTLGIVEEWMTMAAEAVWAIADPAMQKVARARFWEVLVSGEMDVERAAIGVAWWGTGRRRRAPPARPPGASSPALPDERRAIGRERTEPAVSDYRPRNVGHDLTGLRKSRMGEQYSWRAVQLARGTACELQAVYAGGLAAVFELFSSSASSCSSGWQAGYFRRTLSS